MPLLTDSFHFLNGPEPSEDADYYFATKIQSEFYWRRFEERILAWESNPESAKDSYSTYKVYQGAPRFELQPDLTCFKNINWESVVLNRHSTRGFGRAPVSFAQVSNLLTMSFGLKNHGQWLKGAPPDGAWPSRALPSGGGLYPLECYVLAMAVDGLPRGLYHLSLSHGCLSQLRTDPATFDFRTFWGQHRLFGEPSVIFFVTSIFAKSRIKYGARSLRYILLEAGGIASHSNLVAGAMGLDFCIDGGGYENKIEELIGLDPRQEGQIITFMAGHKAK